jgi:hypothetical protein
VGLFYDGVGIMSDNGLRKYVDVNGDFMTGIGYELASCYNGQGYAIVRGVGEPWLDIIDKREATLTGKQYLHLEIYESNRSVIVAQDVEADTWCLMDENLDVILDGLDSLSKSMKADGFDIGSGSKSPDIIAGDGFSFAFARGEKYFIYNIFERKITREFPDSKSFDSFLKTSEDFVMRSLDHSTRFMSLPQ